MKLARAGMFIVFTALQSAALILPAAPAKPEVSIKPIDNAQYELTRHASSTTGILTAQRQLLAIAKTVCDNQPAHFGHDAFNLVAPIEGAQSKSSPKLTFTQTTQCGSLSPSPVPQIANAPDGWKPTPGEQVTVETQTYQYLSAKDGGDYRGAYGMFGDSMKVTTNFDSWQTSAKAFNTAAGHVLNRRVLKITPYFSHRNAAACLAVFPDNFRASSARIEIVGAVPDGAT